MGPSRGKGKWVQNLPKSGRAENNKKTGGKQEIKMKWRFGGVNGIYFYGGNNLIGNKIANQIIGFEKGDFAGFKLGGEGKIVLRF